VFESIAVTQVLETSWLSLQQRVKEARDMDGIIAAHDEYLHGISDKALIDDGKHELQDTLNQVTKRSIG